MILFTTGTINAANAGAVGLATIQKLRDDLIAHAAWELVEEYTPASSLVTWYVFKCLAAESGLSADFYVVMQRTIGDGSIRGFICEAYNAGTHTASKYAGQQTSSTTAYDAQGRQGHTFVLGTATMAGGTNSEPRRFQWAPSGVSTKYWTTVDDDGFTIAFNGASNGFFHVGAYEPLSDLANDLPLQQVDVSQSYGVVTRNPAVASITYKQTALIVESGGSSSASSYGRAIGFRGRLDYNDKLLSDMRAVSEIGMVVYQDSTGDMAQCGFVIGKQKRIRVAQDFYPAGIAFGDAYALNGSLWVPYNPQDARIWDTGVAA